MTRSSNRRGSFALVPGLLFLTLVAACGSDDNSAATTPPPAVTAAGAATETSAATEPSAATETSAETPAELTSINYVEVVRSPLYAPGYIALTQGFFEEEGLDVELQTAGGGDKVTALLVSGDADIALVGPDTTIFVNSNPEGNVKLKMFGLQVLTDGAFLVSREPVDDFTWDDVRGKTIIGFRPGSMPENVLETAIVENGLVIGTDVTVLTDLAAPTNIAAFTEGQGDFLLWVEPTISQLISEGKAHLASSLATQIGPVPYTGYTATEEYIASNPEAVEQWMRAIQRANEWMRGASSQEVAAEIASFFEGVPEDVLASAVDRYREAGVWPDGDVGVPPESEIVRLQDILVDRGVLEDSARLDYSEIIDDSFQSGSG